MDVDDPASVRRPHRQALEKPSHHHEIDGILVERSVDRLRERRALHLPRINDDQGNAKLRRKGVPRRISSAAHDDNDLGWQRPRLLLTQQIEQRPSSA